MSVFGMSNLQSSNIKLILPRKKTGDVVSTYNTNAFELAHQNTLFHGEFREYYNLFNSKLNPEAIQNNVITRSLFLSNYRTYTMCIGLYEEKRHVLVVPNWKEEDYDALYDIENTTPNYDGSNEKHEFAHNPVLSACLWPIWKRMLNGYFAVSVALPKEYSLLRKIFEYYNIQVVECSKPYSLGEDTYSGFTITGMSDTKGKFDVVQLVGHDRPEEGVTYKAEDIKNDFKRYCNDDFLLHDIYRPKGSLQAMMQQSLNLGNDNYRGIVGVENERAIQSFGEFRRWVQSQDHGFILKNNNDSDVSTLLKNGVFNVYGVNRMLHTDSDISKTKFVNPRERISENGLIQTFKESSRVNFEKNKNQYVPIF